MLLELHKRQWIVPLSIIAEYYHINTLLFALINDMIINYGISQFSLVPEPCVRLLLLPAAVVRGDDEERFAAFASVRELALNG